MYIQNCQSPIVNPFAFGGAGGVPNIQMLRAMISMMTQMLDMIAPQYPAMPGPFNRGGCCGGGCPSGPGLSNFCGGAPGNFPGNFGNFGNRGPNLNLNLPGFNGGGFGNFGNCGNQNVNINLPANMAGQDININLPPGFQQNGACGPNLNINLNGQMGQCFGNQGCGRQGNLQQDGKGKPITYTTRGGYKVTVDKDKVSVKDPNGNEVKHHGDPHEDLNGKHIKDWEGKQRSMVLADGTKITLSAEDAKGVTKHTSIYDGGQNVQIDNSKNEVQHQSYNDMDTWMREAAQYDGETAVFRPDANGGAVYYNVYNQAENGAFTQNYDWLGRANGQKVDDLYSKS